MTDKQFKHLLRYIEVNVCVLFCAIMLFTAESTAGEWVAAIIMAGFCIYSAKLKREKVAR